MGDWKNNTGEDRGYLIDTGTDLMRRYSRDKKGALYKIIASRGDNILGQLSVRLKTPKLDYLVLKVNGKRHVLLKPDDSVAIAGEDKICLETIQTNLFNKKSIHLSINGHRMKTGDVRKINKLCSFQGSTVHDVKIKNGHVIMGRVFIRVE